MVAMGNGKEGLAAQTIERAKLSRCAVRWLDCKREAAGTCRHCGGSVPCWSTFGDIAVGKRRPIKPRDDL